MRLRKGWSGSIARRLGFATAFILAFLYHSDASTRTSIVSSLKVEADHPISGAIVLSRAAYDLGDPIPFGFRVTNVATRRVQYWITEFCLDHQVLVTDSHGHEPPWTAEGMSWRAKFGIPNRRVNFPVDLEPGETHLDDGVEWRLDELYRLKPGRYSVRAVFSDSGNSIPHWSSTRPVEFSISN